MATAADGMNSWQELLTMKSNIYFLDGWKEKHLCYKFPRSHLGMGRLVKRAWKRQTARSQYCNKCFDGIHGSYLISY